MHYIDAICFIQSNNNLCFICEILLSLQCKNPFKKNVYEFLHKPHIFANLNNESFKCQSSVLNERIVFISPRVI